jgi:hypothetical protein
MREYHWLMDSDITEEEVTDLQRHTCPETIPYIKEEEIHGRDWIIGSIFPSHWLLVHLTLILNQTRLWFEESGNCNTVKEG